MENNAEILIAIAELERVKAEIEEEKRMYITEVGNSGFTEGLTKSMVIIDEHIADLKGEKQ